MAAAAALPGQKPPSAKEDAYLAKLQKMICDTFSLFDNDNNGTIDKREVGTVLRALNCCPSEGELLDIIKEIEDDASTDYVRLDRFLPIGTKILVDRKFAPAPEEKLLKAFQVLDQEKRGYLTLDEVTKWFTLEGEPFTQEELEELIQTGFNQEKGVLFYKDYLPQLVVEDQDS